MKKIILSIIATTMFIALFSSCQKTDDSSSGNEEQSSDSTVIENEPPNDRKVYDYNSYDELLTALIESNSKEYKELRSEEAKYGKAYQATLKAFSSDKINLYIPKINGNEMKFQEREGFANIALFTNEFHEIPWIWYRCLYNDADVCIRIAYPSVLNNNEVAKAELEGSVIDITKILSPNASLPTKFNNEVFKRMDEKNILLSDSITVSAIISEDSTIDREYVRFTVNNILVSVYAKNGVLTDEFWKGFSIEKY